MIPDAILSCTYLFFGSGVCIYRLINHSYTQFSHVLPQFIFASIGIAAIGFRSMFGLTYNLFWRYYSIDPLLIEQEMVYKKENQYLSDWCLCTIGSSSLTYALYLHYNYVITGTTVITSLILLEIVIYIKNELSKYSKCQNLNDDSTVWPNTQLFIQYLDTTYLTCAWIFTTELFGFAMNNNYICVANIPYSLTMIVYRPFGWYQEWSIRNSMNDYLMLAYIMLISEALFQSP